MIGFVWLCFLALKIGTYYHKLFLTKRLRKSSISKLALFFQTAFGHDRMLRRMHLTGKRGLCLTRHTQYAIRDWLCFSVLKTGSYFHKHFLTRCLHQFSRSQIGFVFSNCPWPRPDAPPDAPHGQKRALPHPTYDIRNTRYEIGFVFSTELPRRAHGCHSPAMSLRRSEATAAISTLALQRPSIFPGGPKGRGNLTHFEQKQSPLRSKLALIGFVSLPQIWAVIFINLSFKNRYVILAFPKLALFFQTRITATKPVLLYSVFPYTCTLPVR